MTNLQITARKPNPDEIDLVEVFRTLWRQKATIFVCAVLAGTLGAIYSFSVTKEYEISSVLRPTAINDLDALNRSEVYKLPPTDALNKVGARLDSYDARFSFFKANPKLFEKFHKPGQSLEQSFEQFNRSSISLFLPDPKKIEPSSYIRLEMRYPDGVDGVAILNGFVDHALALERAEISSDLKVIVDNRLAEIKGQIAAARSNYDTVKESKIALLLERDEVRRAQLQDELQGIRAQMNVLRTNRLADLQEAIAIAHTMGIKRPTTPSSIATSNQVMRTEVNNQAIPLYFMGTDALKAERDTLNQRSNDNFANLRTAEISKELKMLETNREVEILNQRHNEDIFLDNIESLHAENARLLNINTSMKNLTLAAIDRRAQEPLSPVKPRKLLIIGMSLLFGLIAGIIFALSRQYIKNSRHC